MFRANAAGSSAAVTRVRVNQTTMTAPENQKRPPAGRVHEAAQLADLLQRTEVLQQYVALEGPPGIGKTTLINHLLSTLPDWRHLVVELDPIDEQTPGAAVRRLLTVLEGRRPRKVADNVEDLVHHILNVVYSMTGRTVLVMEDIQWMDALSAEVLWRAARDLQQPGSLVVVSYRPHESPFIHRIEQLLASGRRGRLMALKPLTIQGVQEAMVKRLGVPISRRTARIVHEATSGIPLLLYAITNWLTTAPANQRQLSSALSALDSMHDGSQRIFTNALVASLDSLPPAQRFAISLLAVAGKPLRLALVQALLADEGLGAIDVPALQETGLAIAKPDSTDVAIMHPHLAPLLAQHLPIEERVHLHRVLASHTEGVDHLNQRVHALLLAPDPHLVTNLVEELISAGQKALRDGRPDGAFRKFRWALWFSDDPRLLALAVGAAMASEPTRLLPDIRAHLERAPAGRVVSAATGCLRLGEGDLGVALDELSKGFTFPDDDQSTGTLLLCHALVAAGRVAYSSGQFRTIAPVLRIALSHLQPLRAAAEAMPPGPEREHALAEVISIDAMLRLWSGLRHGDPRMLGLAIEELQELLSEIEAVPGTEKIYDTIAGITGVLVRRRGDLATAHSMLHGALSRRRLDEKFQVHLASQLGLIAFQAGYWDEAQQYFTSAIEDSLLLPEDTGVLISHAAAALVPLSRGEKDVGDALLDLVEARNLHRVDVVNVSVWLARAMEALMVQDHAAVAEYFSRIDGTQSGWAHAGHTYMALYARTLVFEKKAHLVPSLLKRFEVEADALPGVLREAISVTMQATLNWAERDVVRTHRQLTRTIELLDSMPPMRPGAAANPGGGHALFRALAASDLAELCTHHPELAEHYTSAARLAQEAAAVFLRCGVTTIHEKAAASALTLLNNHNSAEHSMSHLTLRTSSAADAEAQVLREQAYRHLSELSTRERQIALEVAQGRSNREIATSLFLSVRTVEYHVTNCLAKLNLSSRVELRKSLRAALEVRLVPAAGEEFAS